MDASATKSTLPFRILKAIPSDGYNLDQPVYYGRNGNYLFLVKCKYGSNKQMIWKYDLDKQIIAEQYVYPSELDVLDPVIYIDIDNDIIYTMNNYSYLMSFDLKTKQWNPEICDDDIECSNITLIPSPINQIHLTMNNTHYKLDNENKCIVQLQENIESNMAKFIYSKLTKHLFMFQENCDYILCCEINDKNQKSFNWKKFEIKLPKFVEEYNDFKVILAWDRIIFWFYSNEIWCLDLLNSNYKWYPSNYFIPESWSYVVSDKQNNIHLITRDTERETHDHYKALLYDLLPTEIIELNKNKFDPLVIGFIKKCEKNKQFPFIPIYLKKLVLEFYPIFV